MYGLGTGYSETVKTKSFSDVSGSDMKHSLNKILIGGIVTELRNRERACVDTALQILADHGVPQRKARDIVAGTIDPIRYRVL